MQITTQFNRTNKVYFVNADVIMEGVITEIQLNVGREDNVFTQYKVEFENHIDGTLDHEMVVEAKVFRELEDVTQYLIEEFKNRGKS